MSQSLTLKIKGLYTNANQLSEVPAGALSVADNVVINRDSIAESRRGFDRLVHQLPSLSDRADALFQYQDTLLLHYSTTKLGYYDSSTGVHAYAGSYSHPDALTARMRSAEANKNFYFTSSKGIQKLDSATGTPGQAGMYKGLDCKAAASANPSGFMVTNSQVAYRVVWGITDANDNLVVGVPSQRAVISNSSGANQDVSLQITIPAGITTSHFFQIYRSDQSASSSTEPNDNMKLVYEASPTGGQIAASAVTVIDSTPDTLRGAALYTNDTQEGLLQSNELPPYAADIAEFRNCLFFANIRTKQRLQFSILAVGGSSGVASGDVLTIAGTTYTGGAAENVGTRTFAVVTTGSAAQNIADTALSLVRVINQNAANTSVYAFYVSSPTDLPGKILIEERILGGSTYYITASAHGSAYSPALPTVGTTVPSSNSVNLNGLMYSKQQQPDAVPGTNILYAGSASKKILRILALRDSLFLLKEDGVYRCTGTGPGNFSVDLLDNTVFLLAPESAVTLNNRIFALTTQGVVAISDTGVEVMSRPIEDQITGLFGNALTALKNYSFGVGYESERKYILWTVTTSADTYATQAFVYNFFTKSWTRWKRSQQHALVLRADDKIYAADPLTSYINQERKGGDFHDYTDEAIAITIVSANGLSVVVDDVSTLTVGDLLWQSDSVASVITAIDVPTSTLTVTDTLTWVPGNPAYYLKSIPCTLEWVPNDAQNPGMLKHWTEATLLLRQNQFSTAKLGFYSDISGGLENVSFSGASRGSWGRFGWGQALWGGIVRSLPVRTYVPLEKQRCDLLSVNFSIQEGWASFQIEGLSLVARGISTRVAR